MTFKVDIEYHGPMTKSYKISTGTGKSYHARTLEEVAYGLQHYFQTDLFENKFDYIMHKEHSKVCDCCPLCRGST